MAIRVFPHSDWEEYARTPGHGLMCSWTCDGSTGHREHATNETSGTVIVLETELDLERVFHAGNLCPNCAQLVPVGATMEEHEPQFCGLNAASETGDAWPPADYLAGLVLRSAK